MALVNHTSPPRVPSWQLSAWPERDPECRECGAVTAPSDPQEDAILSQYHGTPCPMKKEQVTLEKDNQRMLRILTENHNNKPAYESPQVMYDERRRAFTLFQCVHKGENVIYAFDLQQALETAIAGEELDESQVNLLLKQFGLLPGSYVSFDSFNAMCDLLMTNQVPNLQMSPPRERDIPMPGSPEYSADKKRPPPAKTVVMKNSVPYHKQMDQKMQVPQKVRVRHGF
eukprot:TRINITY_DN624_c2_g1_i1.p1 TRINITY_DN624_c2_g1~~TRINITY_DN624_c2_g1_i1.p1  ORF type:complete len:244 (+),score=49.36 TRINITY_DN624_c2_g1_i1:49-732(+)